MPARVLEHRRRAVHPNDFHGSRVSDRTRRKALATGQIEHRLALEVSQQAKCADHRSLVRPTPRLHQLVVPVGDIRPRRPFAHARSVSRSASTRPASGLRSARKQHLKRRTRPRRRTAQRGADVEPERQVVQPIAGPGSCTGGRAQAGRGSTPSFSHAARATARRARGRRPRCRGSRPERPRSRDSGRPAGTIAPALRCGTAPPGRWLRRAATGNAHARSPVTGRGHRPAPSARPTCAGWAGRSRRR